MKITLNGLLLVSLLASPCIGQVTARPVLSARPPAQTAPQGKPGAPAGGAGATATPQPSMSNSMALSPEYRIGPYDTLQVTVWKETQLSGVFPVRPDGKISLVLLGDVMAAGETPMQLSATLTDMLKKYIQEPLVTVTVTAVNSQKVYVVGQVQRVGAIDLTPNMTPLEAIAAAGGLNTFTSGKNAYILRGDPGKQQKIPFDYKKALKGPGEPGNRPDDRRHGGHPVRRFRLMLGSAGVLGSVAFAPACLAQAAASVAPPASAPGSNGSADMLSYSLSASESLIFGYNGVNGPSDSVNISGSAGYVSGSERHPLSFVYSGGYLFGNNGQPSSSFQNLGISQVLNTRNWTFLLSDLVSYLPVAPRFGIAGVPGVGDIGTSPIGTGIVPGDALLTNFGRRITNTAIGGATVRLTGRTSVRTSVSYTKQHFLDGDGIENNQFIAGGELDHAFTPATTFGVGYNYADAMYPGANLSFVSQSVVGIFEHTFSAHFNVFASAGPQFTSGSNTTLIPSSTNISINAGGSYQRQRDTYTAGYSHGTSTGSGVLYGALTDNFNLAAQRRFSEQWTGGLFASYADARTLADRSSGLYTSASSVAAGVQANRRLGEHWSVYGSYAAEYQSVGQVLVTDNAFNGTANVLSFGVTYAPRPIRLGRRK